MFDMIKKGYNFVTGNIIALGKSAILSLALVNFGRDTLNFFLAKPDPNIQENCRHYEMEYIVLTTTFLSVTTCLLAYGKKKQTEPSHDVNLPIVNEQMLLLKEKSSFDNLKAALSSICLSEFIILDSLLNTLAIVKLTPWEGINGVLAISSFLLFLNQNIRYSYKIKTGDYLPLHKNNTAKILDLTAVIARVIAAKASLVSLISEIGFHKGLEVFLQTLGIIEPTIFLSKWSNYNSITHNDHTTMSKQKLFIALWMDFFYAASDGVLYAHNVKNAPLINTYLFDCDQSNYLYFALAFAACEALAYGPKLYQVAMSQESNELIFAIQKKYSEFKETIQSKFS